VSRLIIHIGMYKTGTKSVQSFFFHLRDAIGAAGLYYPRSGCVPSEGAHHNIYRAYSERSAERSRYNSQLGGPVELASELSEVQSDVLVSSEAFWALARDEPKQFTRLVHEIGSKRQVTFLVTWRNAAEYCESLYFQNAKNNQMPSIEGSLRSFLKVPGEFEKVVSFITAQFDAELIIIQYNRDMIGQFKRMFSECLGIKLDEELRGQDALNSSLTPLQKLVAAHMSMTPTRFEPNVYRNILGIFADGVGIDESEKGWSIMPLDFQQKLIDESLISLHRLVSGSGRIALFPRALPTNIQAKPFLLEKPPRLLFSKLESALSAFGFTGSK